MTSTTNSYFYPVLEDDRYDYVEQNIYEVEQVTDNTYAKQTDDSLILKYKINGDNLISQLLNSGEAKFVCTTVIKSTMYRETISEYLKELTSTEVVQKIPLQNTYEVQNFAPMIIYIGEDKEIVLNSEKMGLDLFWDGKKINLYKGAIIAKDGWRESEYSASDLLSIQRDESKDYDFEVLIDPKEGGRFVAKVKPDLYDDMNRVRGTKNRAHFNSIITHMLSLGFVKLREDYKDGNEDLANFNAIKRKLKSEDLATWEEDGFNANEVASNFLPHKLVFEDDENE